jgi:hypothetical protein
LIEDFSLQTYGTCDATRGSHSIKHWIAKFPIP